MKTLRFNEYNNLSKHLQKEGSSINEFVKEVTGEFLNEAIVDSNNSVSTGNEDSEKLDVKKPMMMWIKSPKAAWVMRVLTKKAKKALKIIQTNLIAKHYPKTLDNQRQVMQKIKELKKNGKNNKQIAEYLKNINVERIKTMQVKQLQQIDKAIDNIIENSSKKISSFINKNNLSDRRKLTVENYWILLDAQLHQIAYNSMISKEKEFMQSIIKGDKDLVTFAEKLSGKSVFDTFVEKEKKKAAEAKAKIKEDKVEDKVEDKTATKKPTAKETSEEPAKEEPKAKETDKDSEGNPKDPNKIYGNGDVELKRGQIWLYKIESKDGTQKYQKGKILNIGPDGGVAINSVQLQPQEQIGGKWKAKVLQDRKVAPVAIGIDKLQKRSAKLKQEATPEGMFDASKYKKGTIWNYKNNKGDIKQVEIVEQGKDSVRVKYKGTNTAWIVKKEGQLQDQVKVKK